MVNRKQMKTPTLVHVMAKRSLSLCPPLCPPLYFCQSQPDCSGWLSYLGGSCVFLFAYKWKRLALYFLFSDWKKVKTEGERRETTDATRRAEGRTYKGAVITFTKPHESFLLPFFLFCCRYCLWELKLACRWVSSLSEQISDVLVKVNKLGSAWQKI